jgi:hypothetical protein
MEAKGVTFECLRPTIPLAIMSIVCLSTTSMMKVNVVVAWEFQRHWILCHQMFNQ